MVRHTSPDGVQASAKNGFYAGRQSLIMDGARKRIMNRLDAWHRIFVILFTLFYCFAGDAIACFYSSYALDETKNDQTSLEDLLYDRLLEGEKSRTQVSFYAQELTKLRKQLPQKENDPKFLVDYGYILHVTGNTPEAIRVWEKARKLSPSDYRALCNLATAYQMMGDFEKATQLLKQAVQLKPGFRHSAEEFHLRLLEHLSRQRADGNYIRTHLFLPELTSAWTSRKDPPNKFSAASVPRDAVQGLTELLRQFPKQADVWMVLGMLLETQGKWREARLAYQKALKFGCGMSEELRDYFVKYAAFEDKKNPIRYVGWMFLSAFILIILLVVGPRILGTVRAVVEDLQSVRQKQDKTQNKQRGLR
jgi:Flp pilus assembly protein TadD